MDIIQFKDDVFTIENFLSEKECTAIIAYLDAITNAGILDWNQIAFFGSFAMGYWPSDPNLQYFGLPEDYFNQLKNKIQNAGETVFERPLKEISYHAQKWVQGAFAAFHSDNSDEYGNPTAFERSKYAGFLYLNDNFDGGSLNFQHDDITIKPKVGMLAFFKGGHRNEHEVTTVKNGERYTVGSFWDDADSEYDEATMQRWEDELKETRSMQEKQYKEWDENKKKGQAPQYKGKYGY